MINKNSFVKIVNGMRNYWTGLRRFEDALGVYFGDGWMVDIVDNTLDALFEDLVVHARDDCSHELIYRFVLDEDMEQDAEDLYEELIKLKEDNNNEQ
jgi:hypothetical protein